MSTYLKRYEAADNGLRFQGLVYQGNFKEMDPIPDGILGDKILRSRAKSKVLEKVSREDVLRDQFTVDELNDLNNYLAWNIWDVLVMRATEGVSGMIPRQEYEILAFMHEFYRWPEILEMTTNEIGAKGVLEIGATARREIGTKVNCVHDWCIGAVGFGMGRCGLLALEAIQPQDFVRESNIILKFMQRVLWGKRQDGAASCVVPGSPKCGIQSWLSRASGLRRDSLWQGGDHSPNSRRSFPTRRAVRLSCSTVAGQAASCVLPAAAIAPPR